MQVYLSEWVVPISSPPIRGGAVAVEGAEITAVGAAGELLRDHGEAAGSAGVVDLGASVLLPALVNAHTHLELSWMGKEERVQGDFMAWVRQMIGRRRPAPGETDAAIERGIAAIRGSGAALVGDVGNTLAALGRLGNSGLRGRFFLELIGDREGPIGYSYDQASRTLLQLESSASGPVRARGGSAVEAGPGTTDAPVIVSIVPHGPHTVPSSLLRRLADRAARRGEIVSVHVSESAAEVELLQRGTGPFRGLLDQLGALGPDWQEPGLSPIEVLDGTGLLGPRTLAVHCVHATPGDVRILAARGATVVLCPRSNAALGVGRAPVERLVGAGVRLALGTDSLASNDDLSIVAELAALRRLAPGLPAEPLLRAATLGGAEALGLASHFGSLEPGKRATLVQVRKRERIGTGMGLGDGAEAPQPPTHPRPPGRDSGRHLSRSSTPGAERADLRPGAPLFGETGPASGEARSGDEEPYATLFSGPGDVSITPIP